MTDIPQIEKQGPAIWRLALPDWESLDTVRKDPLPFALWQVGEQALLFHWLDAAVDQGTERVEFLVTDRPLEIRQHISNASLWPIEIDVRTVSASEQVTSHDRVDRLPSAPKLEHPPSDGWSLLKHWFQMEQDWVANFTKETEEYGAFAALGKFCEVAEDVTFKPPYWIGDFVSIGPGSTIGPGVVIENGCVLAGENEISQAHIAAHTYLAPHTELENAALHGSTLFNFKHQACVNGLESFIAAGVNPSSPTDQSRPSLKERWIAFRLILRLAKYGYSSETTFNDIHGVSRPLLQDDSPRARGPWLKEVVAGKMALFGLTPRPEPALSELPLEWQNIFRKAPTAAFSYADVLGVHEIGSEEETMHCVYQASTPGSHCHDLFENWIQSIR